MQSNLNTFKQLAITIPLLTIVVSGSYVFVDRLKSNLTRATYLSQFAAVGLTDLNFPVQTSTTSIKPTIDTLKEAVPTIYAGSKIGSGVLIAPDLVITCAHVVEKKSVNVVFVTAKNSNLLAEGTVLFQISPSQIDLAIIKLSQRVDITPINLSAEAAKTEQSVTTIGSPLGNRGVVKYGKVLAVNDISVHYSQITLQGHSGGALLDSNGRLVGITKQIYENANGEPEYGIASDVPTIQFFLERYQEDKRHNSRPSL